jgi:ATP-dependent DNA helicase RecG
LRRDRELIEHAREVAFRIIDDDPELAQSDVLRSEIALLLSEREGDYLTKS